MGEALKQLEENSFDVTRIDTIREELKNFLNEGVKKQSVVSRSLGVSETALSQFLSSKYQGNSAIIAEKAEQFLALEHNRLEAPKIPTFAITKTVKEIWFAVKHAHINNDIALIYGDAGRGKSEALKQYTTENKGTVYVEADSTTMTTKAILEEILEILGKHRIGSERVLKNAIIDTLKDSGRLIIIDEAQHLTLKAVEALRALNDKGKIGLVLAGNQSVYDRMYGRGEAHFAQLFSRVGIKRNIASNIDKVDIEEIFKGKSLDAECLDYLHFLANTKGGLRYMMKIYMLAVGAAQSQGECINTNHIKFANKLQSGNT